MKKFVSCFLLFFCVVLAALAASPRNAQSVKRDKQATQREINETQRKIKENQKQTRRKLDELNNITGKIDMQQAEIARINSHLDSVNTAIRLTEDTIAQMETVTAKVRQELKKTLRSLRSRRQAVSNIAFVFSSKNFSKAVKRVNYIGELNRWRSRKVRKLQEQIALVREKQEQLRKLRSEHARALTSLDAARQVLETRRHQESEMVAQLKKEGKNLNVILDKKRKRARELDRELDRIIAEEQRRIAAEKAAREKAAREKAAREKAEREKANRPGSAQQGSQPAKPTTPPAQKADEAYAESERKLSGSFAANKGRLLFPVAGRYSIVGAFGRNSHREIANMQVDNSGIDISVASGTKARAVFSGTVSSVFFMPGYQNVVILRHGEYLTVYAGLTALSVKKGMKVSAGTPLGTVFTDSANDNQTILHFEVRKERQKLNPLQWVK